ncbi:MAG: hypothetical protein ABI760_06380 [Ferruginibacter sp.]
MNRLITKIRRSSLRLPQVAQQGYLSATHILYPLRTTSGFHDISNYKSANRETPAHPIRLLVLEKGLCIPDYGHKDRVHEISKNYHNINGKPQSGDINIVQITLPGMANRRAVILI